MTNSSANQQGQSQTFFEKLKIWFVVVNAIIGFLASLCGVLGFVLDKFSLDLGKIILLSISQFFAPQGYVVSNPCSEFSELLNIADTFYRTSLYTDANKEYRRALELIEPDAPGFCKMGLTEQEHRTAKEEIEKISDPRTASLKYRQFFNTVSGES